MKTRGFTLIELLVVIAIIGLLASIVMASLSGAKSKARDAIRLSDMQTIRTALEMYANNHGNYPASIPGGSGTWYIWECGNKNDSAHQFMPYLVSDGELSTVPEESTWASNICIYRYAAPVVAGTACGSPSGNYAAFYEELENPSPANCKQPACMSSWGWGESSASDPNGCLMLLPM